MNPTQDQAKALALFEQIVGEAADNGNDVQPGFWLYESAAVVRTALSQPTAAQPLTLTEIGAAARAAHIAFCLGKFTSYDVAFARFIEQAIASQGTASQEVE